MPSGVQHVDPRLAGGAASRYRGCPASTVRQSDRTPFRTEVHAGMISFPLTNGLR